MKRTILLTLAASILAGIGAIAGIYFLISGNRTTASVPLQPKAIADDKPFLHFFVTLPPSSSPPLKAITFAARSKNNSMSS